MAKRKQRTQLFFDGLGLVAIKVVAYVPSIDRVLKITQRLRSQYEITTDLRRQYKVTTDLRRQYDIAVDIKGESE